LISFYLIWPFNLKKTAPSLKRVATKISSKLGAKGIKRSRILRWFKKCVELLHQEVPKDFFSEKWIFAKFSKSLKIQFFCKNFFPFAKLKTSAHFLTLIFFWTSLRILRPNQKHMKNIEFLKKCQNHWILTVYRDLHFLLKIIVTQTLVYFEPSPSILNLWHTILQWRQ
jgi:hypothetical protein